jgi:hypothetical protein
VHHLRANVKDATLSTDLSITYDPDLSRKLLLIRLLVSSASDLATMRLQHFLLIALAAYESVALTLPRASEKLQRRQTGGSNNNGTTLIDALGSVVSGLLGGSQSIAGMVSGYSIASMFVTAVNCKSHVRVRGQET